ncbi:hypothetical protein [Saccharothrix coeruleofusca]|uniref:Uncharacterized protein n=1 Tax=Saccharothrix coeruleofusca TaxID=33919 RepID=A0A918AVL7_9PSEU|nr:hypothetical protein [Saccharothrix coeruleofusca]GGP83117.1 hypothetical protein GCM10010185_66340 [Saccharothrix coeruleofusca]
MNGEFWVTLLMGMIAGFTVSTTIVPVLAVRRVRRLVHAEVRAAIRGVHPSIPFVHTGQRGKHRRVT